MPQLTEDFGIVESKSQEPRKAGFKQACVLLPTKSYLGMLSPLGTYLYMMAQPYH